jgi:hypothetical protein
VLAVSAMEGVGVAEVRAGVGCVCVCVKGGGGGVRDRERGSWCSLPRPAQPPQPLPHPTSPTLPLPPTQAVLKYHALSSTRRRIPYTHVRTASNWLVQPLKQAGASGGDGSVCVVSPAWENGTCLGT